MFGFSLLTVEMQKNLKFGRLCLKFKEFSSKVLNFKSKEKLTNQILNPQERGYFYSIKPDNMSLYFILEI